MKILTGSLMGDPPADLAARRAFPGALVPMGSREEHDVRRIATRADLPAARKALALGASLNEAAELIGVSPASLDEALWRGIGK